MNQVQQQALSDGASIAFDALNAIKTAIDATFGKVEAAIPQLTGDTLSVAEDFLDNLAPASVRPFVAQLIGSFAFPARATLSTIDARAVAALAIANANIDAAVGQLAKFRPPSPAPTQVEQMPAPIPAPASASASTSSAGATSTGPVTAPSGPEFEAAVERAVAERLAGAASAGTAGTTGSLTGTATGQVSAEKANVPASDTAEGVEPPQQGGAAVLPE